MVHLGMECGDAYWHPCRVRDCGVPCMWCPSCHVAHCANGHEHGNHRGYRKMTDAPPEDRRAPWTWGKSTIVSVEV